MPAMRRCPPFYDAATLSLFDNAMMFLWRR
jgi:hypothetical protein